MTREQEGARGGGAAGRSRGAARSSATKAERQRRKSGGAEAAAAEGRRGEGGQGEQRASCPRTSAPLGRRAVPGRGLASTVSPRPCRPPSFSGIRVGPAWLSPLFRSPCSAPGAGLGTGGWIRTPEGCALA